MSIYKKLDKSLKLFEERYKYILDEYGSHEIRFSYGGNTPSGNYSACFTFSFPRKGADKILSRKFNKMVEDFRKHFNFEECKQGGSYWQDVRDQISYNFINPIKKTNDIYCSLDKSEWVTIQKMRSLLENKPKTTPIHIRYLSNLGHYDILNNIELVRLIKSSVKKKYNSDNYLKEIDEDDLIKSITKYLNRTCDSDIKSIETEKTITTDYFLENYNEY